MPITKVVKGTTTHIHADDSAQGTVYDYSDSDGYKQYLDEIGWTDTYTVKDALDQITYTSLAGDYIATETLYGYTQLASEADMNLITVNGGADDITDVVTVKQLQYWVNTVAPATTYSNGFVTLTPISELTRTSTSGTVMTMESFNAFLNDSDNAGTVDQFGALKLATISEANAGTNTTKAVTPQGLRQIVDSAVGQSNSIVATESVLGNTRLATSSESIAGNNNTDCITPSTNRLAFDSWIDDWWDENDNSQFLADLINSWVGQESNFPAAISGTPNGHWVKKNGSLLSRSTYPSLWAWVQSRSELLVSESSWQSLKNQSPTGAVGVYSSGNGSTTFRVPTVGTRSGFPKSVGTSESLGYSTARIGFLSNNRSHNHSTNTNGEHTHNVNPHNHTATFAGAQLPNHNHGASFSGNALPAHSHTVNGVGSWNYTWEHGDGRNKVGPRQSENSRTSSTSAGTPSGRVTIGATSGGRPSGTVTIANANTDTQPAGDHTHSVNYEGANEATPVGFYVMTFIYAGSQTITETQITPDVVQQINANTAAIADIENQVGVPVGTIIAYDNTDPLPFGWVLCDGQNGTPDLRGRFLVGEQPTQTDYGSMDFRTKGRYGGTLKYIHNHTADVQGHVLTWEEIPPHKHTTTWGSTKGPNTDEYAKFGVDARQGTNNKGTNDADINSIDYDNYNNLTSGYIVDPNSTDGLSYSAVANEHDHDIVLGSNTQYIAPPYYVTVWIKRVA